MPGRNQKRNQSPPCDFAKQIQSASELILGFTKLLNAIKNNLSQHQNKSAAGCYKGLNGLKEVLLQHIVPLKKLLYDIQITATKQSRTENVYAIAELSMLRKDYQLYFSKLKEAYTILIDQLKTWKQGDYQNNEVRILVIPVDRLSNDARVANEKFVYCANQKEIMLSQWDNLQGQYKALTVTKKTTEIQAKMEELRKLYKSFSEKMQSIEKDVYGSFSIDMINPLSEAEDYLNQLNERIQAMGEIIYAVNVDIDTIISDIQGSGDASKEAKGLSQSAGKKKRQKEKNKLMTEIKQHTQDIVTIQNLIEDIGAPETCRLSGHNVKNDDAIQLCDKLINKLQQLGCNFSWGSIVNEKVEHQLKQLGLYKIVLNQITDKLIISQQPHPITRVYADNILRLLTLRSNIHIYLKRIQSAYASVFSDKNHENANLTLEIFDKKIQIFEDEIVKYFQLKYQYRYLLEDLKDRWKRSEALFKQLSRNQKANIRKKGLKKHFLESQSQCESKHQEIQEWESDHLSIEIIPKMEEIIPILQKASGAIEAYEERLNRFTNDNAVISGGGAKKNYEQEKAPIIFTRDQIDFNVQKSSTGKLIDAYKDLKQSVVRLLTVNPHQINKNEQKALKAIIKYIDAYIDALKTLNNKMIEAENNVNDEDQLFIMGHNSNLRKDYEVYFALLEPIDKNLQQPGKLELYTNKDLISHARSAYDKVSSLIETEKHIIATEKEMQEQNKLISKINRSQKLSECLSTMQASIMVFLENMQKIKSEMKVKLSRELLPTIESTMKQLKGLEQAIRALQNEIAVCLNSDAAIIAAVQGSSRPAKRKNRVQKKKTVAMVEPIGAKKKWASKDDEYYHMLTLFRSANGNVIHYEGKDYTTDDFRTRLYQLQNAIKLLKNEDIPIHIAKNVYLFRPGQENSEESRFIDITNTACTF